MSIYHSQFKSEVPAIKRPTSSIDKAVIYMIENYTKPISLVEVAEAAGVSKYKLIRDFHRYRHQSPMKWLRSYRILRSIDIMRHRPNLAIKEIAYLSGFMNSAHFSRIFKQHLKMTPIAYRRYIIESGLHEVQVSLAHGAANKDIEYSAAALA